MISRVLYGLQASRIPSLPVKLGGLGVRSAVEMAPSAYLASLQVTSVLVEAILLVTFTSSEPSLLDDVVSWWLKGHGFHDFQPPVGVCVIKQKSWDQLRALAIANQLVEDAMDDIDRAHLLASSAKESRAWLHALSISA